VTPRETAAHAREAHSRLHMAFDANSLLSQLFGEATSILNA